MDLFIVYNKDNSLVGQFKRQQVPTEQSWARANFLPLRHRQHYNVLEFQ